MNIFFLALCVRQCARDHVDAHVIKMILELTQLLSTAWHMLDQENAANHLESGLIYRKTHYNHPCAKWVREHINNYNFTAELAHQLCDEWRRRWRHDKIHGCEPKLDFLFDNSPPNIPRYHIPDTDANPHGFTFPMPQAMPDECRFDPDGTSMSDCIKAYRKYYKSDHKSHLHSWTIANSEFISASKTPDEPKRMPLERPEWF